MAAANYIEKKGPTLQTDNQHTNHKSPAGKSEIIQLTNRTGAHCQHTVMDSLHGGRGKIGCTWDRRNIMPLCTCDVSRHTIIIIVALESSSETYE